MFGPTPAVDYVLCVGPRKIYDVIYDKIKILLGVINIINNNFKRCRKLKNLVQIYNFGKIIEFCWLFLGFYEQILVPDRSSAAFA